MRKSIIVFIALFFAAWFVHAQESTEADTSQRKQAVKEKSTAPNVSKEQKQANKLFKQEKFGAAEEVWKKIYAQHPGNANVNFKLGLCYFFIPGKQTWSLPYFRNAVTSTTSHHSFNSTKETKASADAYYFLGAAYLASGNPDSALHYFVRYEDMFDGNPPLDANRQVHKCINAKNMMDSPRNVNVVRAKQGINTNYNEAYPVISLDNQVMFFASSRPRADGSNKDVISKVTGEHFWDIYFVKRTESGKWGEPQWFEHNTDKDDIPLCFSADGKTLYIARQDENSFNIYQCSNEGFAWSVPEMLNKNINKKKADETGASLSLDGSTLYFSSNRSGGEGKFDLYYATRKEDGEWGKAKNLSKVVNHTGSETSPYFHPGSNKLYYTSNSYKSVGMGGYDIYFTEKKEKVWEQPTVMDFPINGTGDELQYYLASEGSRYVASCRDSGELDIYSVEGGEEIPAEEVVGLPEAGTKVEEEVVSLLEVGDTVVDVQEVETKIGEIDVSQLDDVDQLMGIEQRVEVAEVPVEKEVEVVSVQEVPVSEMADQPLQPEKQGNFPDVNAMNAEDSGSEPAPNEQKAADHSKERLWNEENETALKDEKAKATEPDTEETEGVYHRVRPGQTLFSIAREYGTSVDELMRLNKLGNNYIYVGQVLTIKPEGEPQSVDRSSVASLEMLQNLDMRNMSELERQVVIEKVKSYLFTEVESGNPTIFKTLYFDFNSRNLSLLSEEELEVLIQFLQENPTVNIEIVGHTDNTGDWDDNFWVSRERAYTVYNYLAEKNISKKRMIFNGKGSTAPIADNSTRQGRRLNRRVEIVLLNN